MKESLLTLFFFFMLGTSFAYGQGSGVVAKKPESQFSYGEMEIEVRINRLYSYTYDSWATTRHRWYVKSYSSPSVVHSTYSTSARCAAKRVLSAI
jgi:hypothetical protein